MKQGNEHGNVFWNLECVHSTAGWPSKKYAGKAKYQLGNRNLPYITLEMKIGVGFIVSKKANRSVLGFSPICERICTLRIKGKFHNITFVNVYAPTEDTEDEKTDEFYETLQLVCDELPKHDAIITLGDLMPNLAKNKYIETSLDDIAYMKPQITMVLD